ncbi:sucrose synthase [Iningainema tapete]|uniref:Sucrose synthase n=1 Tax=Iningainema tapete BLCC-T55 TaxID=2748662 RepID=A0A8J6XS37_9CYAN|nr:sucrose synthase [Iningainema tapete]MBD2778557.1 sucrose synthase [Iningainema tapete BLCC-T55]
MSYELIKSVLNSEEKTALRELLSALGTSHQSYFLRNDILQAFADYTRQSHKQPHFYHSSALGKLLHHTHEIILQDNSSWFVVRPWIGSQQVWRIATDASGFELVKPEALLDVLDAKANHYQPQILEIDVSPFYDSPTIGDPRNVGQGLNFLNHYLCDKLFTEPEYWLEALFQVLKEHQHDGIPLLINSDRIKSGTQLVQIVKETINFLTERSPEEPYEKLHPELQKLGLEPGWGNTTTRVRETLELFNRLIDTPQPAILEAFVSRIPAIFRIVSVSIHGWVGQENVLGRTETLGQVVYVIDQARYLENKLREDIKLAGLDFLRIQPQVIILTRLIPNCEGTQCNLRLEKVENTENAWILRVPFQQFNPKVTDNWISKYEIWPYLESFALDAEKELLARLGGRPNLIIGNNSDGNLVAFLLARRLQVTQCNIAHALEKPKNLFSNLYWQDLEEQYHFSTQFTADLITMNAADFIITSSYQEIVGTPDTVGQYESYKCFTMPGLYHVVDGIDVFSPKFNLVPPGINENVFFPYTQTGERDESIRNQVSNLLFSQEDAHIQGKLHNPKLRPIFAFAPITAIKNLSGLAECFGKSQALQEHCNLILITSKLNESQATNPEEAEEIAKLHKVIEDYHLHNHIRWIGMRLSPDELGEAYRVIADASGIFIHFARFEAFGQTILEAMISGLPTFATQFGGSSEIIQDGQNGFLVNPTDLEGTAEKILHFINQCDTDPQYWHEISERSLKRIHEHYNWQIHTKQLLLLAKIYTFWNYVYSNNRQALLRYIEAVFYLLYKPRAEKILEQHMQR